MPLIPKSTYHQTPFGYYSGHLQTILPCFFRKIPDITYQRERLELPDGDFLDLDWLPAGASRLVVLSHGVGGSSGSSYMKAAAKYFSKRGFDVLAWNCRGCSGEPNRLLRMYHHGEIEDIGQVILHALRKKNYKEIYLVGYSMGGSITLKYLGVNGKAIPKAIKKAVAISAPPDLAECIEKLDRPENYFYKNDFKKSLFERISQKAQQYPGKLDLSKIKAIKSWRDFDFHFTLPVNNFNSLESFYYQASYYNYAIPIDIPVLAINAENDPIVALSQDFRALCQMHPKLYLETPAEGGHVGFTLPNQHCTWMEMRAFEFFGQKNPLVHKKQEKHFKAINLSSGSKSTPSKNAVKSMQPRIYAKFSFLTKRPSK